jgi:hypothetical protein
MKKLIAALLLTGIFVPAHAGMLYKSIGPNGTVIFSDMPPGGDARIVEQRVIGTTSNGSPVTIGAASPLQLIDSDEAVQRANAQVDQAEHELALARRGTWSAHEGLRLVSTRPTMSDIERVEFYKRNLRSARQYLAELLRERQSPSQGSGRVVLSAASY